MKGWLPAFETHYTARALPIVQPKYGYRRHDVEGAWANDLSKGLGVIMTGRPR